jgi:UDP-glucose 4-epimerase
LKIFVTAANGFIGSSIVKGMGARGHEVFGISRNKPEHDAASSIQAPLTRAALAPLLAAERPDVLIHCAGASTVFQAQNAPYEDFGNTVGTVAESLESIRENSSSTLFVLISSASVYGDRTGTPLTESLAPSPTSVYGYNKLLAEILVRQYQSEFEIESLIFRPFSIYGEGLKKQVIYDTCMKALAGHGPLIISGTGDETRDFMHIDDLVAGIGSLIQQRQTGIVNLGTGRSTRLADLLSMIVGRLAPGREFRFDGRSSTQNPKSLVADMTHAQGLGVRSTISLEEGVRRVCEALVPNSTRL